jgi:hypothetical protein
LDRLRDLEKATAVAFLDANLSGEGYATEARKVTEAVARGQHFRLVVETIEASGSVHATIEVECAEVTDPSEVAITEEKDS